MRSNRHHLHSKVLLAVLFLTAFSSLVYELVWTRELSYIFGSTALAASSVLAVFMGGLALGSLYAGRILESRLFVRRGRAGCFRQPHIFLATLQLIIGITCILTLFAIKGTSQLQYWLFAFVGEQATFVMKVLLFMLTSCVLIVPTFFIGIAFPIVVQLYHGQQELVGKSVGRCYWIDTLGASLGILLAAFYLVEQFGFLRTSIIASLLNVLTGLCAFLFFRGTDSQVEQRSVEPAPKATSAGQTLNAQVICFLFFLSGFAALVLEVLWIRHWGLIYGSGLHGFAMVVVVFLLGLSFGGLFYDVCLKNIRNQVLLFSLLELALGASAVIITALFPHLEKLFLVIYGEVESYAAFMVALGFVCFLVLLIPTMLMGMTLPALCAVNASQQQVATDVGRLYAVNSFGALAGSFCAGFIIIPALGLSTSSFIVAAIYVFVAFAFLFCFSEPHLRLRRTTLAFMLILVLTGFVFAGLHKQNHLYAGVFYAGPTYETNAYETYARMQRAASKMLRFKKEGVYGQIAAYGIGLNMVLNNNGRIDSATTSETRPYQTMLGIIPMLIHEKPSRVLNIGLGAGWTVSAVVQHTPVESVDCVEINPLIVEVNKKVFFAYNNDVLNHAKLNIIVNDGRNYVANTRKTYDVIISEPPEFWFAGVSALFTKEFYAHALEALNAGGLLCQWFPTYEITERDYKIALKTIKAIFPYTYEFSMSKLTNDTYESFVVMASREEIDVEARLAHLKLMYQDPEDKNVLSFVNKMEAIFTRDHDALSTYVADVDQVNTDDLPVLEFGASRDRFRKFRRHDGAK